MAKTREQKVQMVEKLTSALKDAATSVFVSFTGLTVADETAMRRALKTDGVAYTVVKKTLLRRAIDALGHDSNSTTLDGEIAVAYGSQDVTAPARLVHEFGKKYAGKLTIMGGLFEGKLASGILMQEIATIPSLNTLRAMFAQVINSPRQRFAVVLSEVAKIKQ